MKKIWKIAMFQIFKRCENNKTVKFKESKSLTSSNCTPEIMCKVENLFKKSSTY